MAVRKESVLFEAQDQYSTKVARMAATTALLKREINSLSGTTAKIRADFDRSAVSVDRLSVAAVRGDRSINQLTGRLRLLADVAAIFGPALAPIGAVAVPAVTGLASQLGFAAVGMAALVTASQGVGDAFKAVVEADLDPTVENLDAAREAMSRLAPEAQEFVRALNEARPMFAQWRDSAAGGLFPGVTEAIDDLEQVSGLVEDIMGRVAGVAGDSAAGFGDWLVGDDGREFLRFIRDEAPSALAELSATLGATARGLGNLWMGFTPLNQDFSAWLLSAAEGFERWSDGLAQTEGFAEFVEYVRTNGPIVADSMQSLANAVLQIVEAAAPLGGPVLQTLGKFADVIAGIADSDLGTPIMAGVAALALYNRALAGVAATQARLNGMAAGGGLLGGFVGERQGAAKSALAGARRDVSALAATWATAGARTTRESARMSAAASSLRGNLSTLAKEGGRVAGPLAGIAVASSGAADGLGLTNTASLALIGTMGGPWGAAAGGAIGLFMDLQGAASAAGDALDEFNASMNDGNLEGAERALQQMRGELTKTEGIFRGLAMVPGGALLNKAFGFDEGKEGAEDYRRAVARLEQAQDRAAQNEAYSRMFREQRRAMAASRGAARDTAREFVNLGDSLDDGKVSLRGWLRELEKQADALRNFQRNAQTAADRGLRQGLIDALHEAGPAGAMRMRQLANATDAEIDRANRAWQRGQGAIRDYTNTVGGVPPSKATEITVEGVGAAVGAIGALTSQINSIPNREVWITVRRNVVGGALGGLLPNGGEDGGRVYGGHIRRAAYGDMVPDTGRGYADRHLYLLADREHIVSNKYGQADKNRPELEAANRGAKLAVVGYANGGEIRSAPTSGTGGGGAPRIVSAPQVSLAGLTLRANVEGLGDVMFTIADEVVGSYRTHDRRQAATVYTGVSDD